MAATVTVTLTEPVSNQGERTVFSGCSEDDQACAKLFWQSLTLQPPIESRLVSGDVGQRLKVAPPGRQREIILTTVKHVVKSTNIHSANS